MTDAERRALAFRWHQMPSGDEWGFICDTARLLKNEGNFPDKALTTIIYRALNGQYTDEFDRLALRVLERKLLGETK